MNNSMREVLEAMSNHPSWKTIATEYSGIKYSSRLEASWAQYFDHHGIDHRYQFDQVDLEVCRYTPDFWLPDFRVWIEIKPYRQYKPHSKCFRLAELQNVLVLLVQGRPSTGDHVVDIFERGDESVYGARSMLADPEIKPSRVGFSFDMDGVELGEFKLINRRGEVLIFTKSRSLAG